MDTPSKVEISVVKLSGSMKLYAHLNIRTMNKEETSSLVPWDIKKKIDYGNNMFLFQRESSSNHENIPDFQRYHKNQTSDCFIDHVPKKLKISQHSTIRNCLITDEFLHDLERTILTPVFDEKGYRNSWET